MKKKLFKKFVLVSFLAFIVLNVNIIFADEVEEPPVDVDIVAPVITLIGEDSVIVIQGQDYVEEGATAVDDIDGDVNVDILGDVNTKVAGNYTLTYTAVDSSNNSTDLTRIVKVEPVSIETIHLSIETSDGNLYDQDITVFSCEESPDSGIYTTNAYCAVVQSGLDNEWSWWGSDAFLSSVGSYANNDNDNGVYWGWFANLELGSTGLNKYILNEGDKILLNYNTNPLRINVGSTTPAVGDTVTVTVTEFGYDDSWNPAWVSAFRGVVVVGVNIFDLDEDGKYQIEIMNTDVITLIGKKEGYIDSFSLEINPVPAPEEGGGSVGGGSPDPIVVPKVFSVPEALSFLSLNQNEDGSFSSDIYTDWVAIAVAKAGDEGQELKTKIYDYLINQDINFSIITDYERRAMALMALNINPYSGTNINYIEKISNSFDGTQIGDSSIYNDDIFGLIVLANAGYTSSENIIEVVVDFIISKQNGDGSWGSVDITAAAIQALDNFKDIEGSTSAISKGLTYLSVSQDEDGGFGNSFSTSWVAQVLSPNAIAVEYLAEQQQDDGGVDDISNLIDTRIWATSYAIPAVLSLSWNNILNDFSKPVVVVPSGGGGSFTPSTPEELPPAPIEETISDLMAVIETIPQEELIENIPQVKEPINKIILKKENIIEVAKIDEVDDTTKNLLQASVATAQPVEPLPAWKIIALIAGILWIVVGGFVLKFKI